MLEPTAALSKAPVPMNATSSPETAPVKVPVIEAVVFPSYCLLVAVASGIVKLIVLIVYVKVAKPVPPELVALNETVYIPAAVGVPVISPVAVLILNPGGNPVALNDNGSAVAVIKYDVLASA